MVYTKNDLKVLHVHIPKTGGGSITSFFEKNFDKIPVKIPELGWNYAHAHADLINKYIDLSDIDFIFTFIRNPIDRFISVHNYQCFTNAFSGDLDEFCNFYESESHAKSGFCFQHTRKIIDFINIDKLQIFNFLDFKPFIDKLNSLGNFNFKYSEIPHKNNLSYKKEISNELRSRLESILNDDIDFYKNYLINN